MNDSDLKANLAETKIYYNFLKIFNLEKIDSQYLEEDKDGNDSTENNEEKIHVN